MGTTDRIRRALQAEADRQELADREKRGTSGDPLKAIRDKIAKEGGKK